MDKGTKLDELANKILTSQIRSDEFNSAIDEFSDIITELAEDDFETAGNMFKKILERPVVERTYAVSENKKLNEFFKKHRKRLIGFLAQS